MVAGILIGLIVVALGYVRLAPSDPARWHRAADVAGMGGVARSDGYIWREEIAGIGNDTLRALDAVIMETPRTTRLAGSVDDAMITYVTRSRLFGFPDYTTVSVQEDAQEGEQRRYLEIFGRLRFGRSDLGVNAKRIKGWLARLQAGR